jgi:hypothetical protein
MPEGRIREALEQTRIAEKFDPLSSAVRSELAHVLLSPHLYDEAPVECQIPFGKTRGSKRCASS